MKHAGLLRMLGSSGNMLSDGVHPENACAWLQGLFHGSGLEVLSLRLHVQP